MSKFPKRLNPHLLGTIAKGPKAQQEPDDDEGLSNFATLVVSHAIEADQERYWHKRAKERFEQVRERLREREHSDNQAQNYNDVELNAPFLLALDLMSHFEANAPNLPDGVYRELLAKAVSSVEWGELADELIENARMEDPVIPSTDDEDA
ncbi:MAG: hypothetical protein JSV66_02105 [Trueperaceae bacterium]|nr:MAG: hypothetical protein JSV66_02105 [Trueperaceae bacterium]